MKIENLYSLASLFTFLGSEKVSKIHAANTEKVTQKIIFGGQIFFFNKKLFWSQNRLKFLERALKKH